MFEAAIFDMDGLLIDSEPFWSLAEKEVFSAVGVNITEELALLTSRMTTKEVTAFWYSRQPWPNNNLEEIEQAVIAKVGQYIDNQGVIMPGVLSALQYVKQKGYKIGLATNSPYPLASKVLHKLQIAHYFDAISTADVEASGKPSPDVYLAAAQKLNVPPTACIAFEDSISGIRAALAAGMTAIAVPHHAQLHNPSFDIAHAKLRSLEDLNSRFLESAKVTFVRKA